MARAPSPDDTAELPALRPSDPSWFVLAVAALASLAFLAGVELGRPNKSQRGTPVPPPASGRQTIAGGTRGAAGPSSPRPVQASTRPQAHSSRPGEGTLAPPKGTRAPTSDGYMVGASLSPQPPQSIPLALPASAKRIYYYYSLPGWPSDTRIAFSWRLRGKSLSERLARWEPDHAARWAKGRFVLVPPQGAKKFPPGIYEVELLGPDDLSDVGSFAVLEGLDKLMAQQPPVGAVMISKPVVSLSVDPQGRPTAPTEQVPADAPAVYACFSYDGAMAGTALVVAWSCEGVEVPQARYHLRLPGTAGLAYAVIKRRSGPLVEGKWKVAVYLEGGDTALGSADFQVVPAAKKESKELQPQP